MLQIKKITIGVQPAMKMFRLQSSWGAIFDSLFSSLGSGVLEKNFFSGVAAPRGVEQYQARGDDNGNYLNLSMDNIVFSKSYYGKDSGVNVDKFIQEFIYIWGIIQKKLAVSNIRRIGVVAEHRSYGIEKPSAYLLPRLIRSDFGGAPNKLMLNFESRHPSSIGGKNSVENGEDFINLIYQIYDSTLDSEHPESNSLNFNLDVQRYYSPLLNKDEVDHFKIAAREFEKHWRDYQSQIQKMGLLANVE